MTKTYDDSRINRTDRICLCGTQLIAVFSSLICINFNFDFKFKRKSKQTSSQSVTLVLRCLVEWRDNRACY